MAVRDLWSRTTRTDRWIILLLGLLVVASLSLTLGRAPGKKVVVYAEERIVFTGPLDQQRHLVIPGPLGETVLDIEQGKVQITTSPCPRKICIGMGSVHRAGDLLACVPNRIVVRIEGNDSGEYDLLSR